MPVWAELGQDRHESVSKGVGDLKGWYVTSSIYWQDLIAQAKSVVLTTVWQSMVSREHAWRARGSSWPLYKSLLLARVLSLTPRYEGSVLSRLEGPASGRPVG